METIKMYVHLKENKYIHSTSPHRAMRRKILMFHIAVWEHPTNLTLKGK